MQKPRGFLSQPEEDARVLPALVRGEREAVAWLWERYVPMVRRILRRGLGPAGEIDDLVQETFLTFFRRVHTVRDPKALRMFMLSLTSNLLRDELRRRQRTPRLAFTAPDRLPEPAARGSDLEAREALRRFYRVLDALEPEERTVFVLRYVEDVDLADLAGALRVSLATLKRRLGRVAARVQALVADDPALAEFLAEGGGWITPPKVGADVG
jgi:RNA polymerase sigma-70 factor (ECF subfamily)